MSIILGLDISTSTVGISLFKDKGKFGELLESTHISPKVKEDTALETYIKKADVCLEFIYDKYKTIGISEIIVEEPLKHSNNQKTAKILEIFNEYMVNRLEKFFNVKVKLISVNDIRKSALKELVVGKAFLKNFPRKIKGVSITDYRKLIIMYLVSKRFKQVQWMLNTSQRINKKNYDRADAILVVLGQKIKEGAWVDMADTKFYGFTYNQSELVEFIEKNIAYEESLSHINKQKIPSEKKKELRLINLLETYNIPSYINLNTN